MKINAVNSLNFLNQIKVKLPNKQLNEGGYKKGDLNKVITIAGKNNTDLLIGKDVVILGSSSEIKEDLNKAKLEFEEIRDVTQR